MMPRSRHSLVTLPRLKAKVMTTIAAMTRVIARRVSASPGSETPPSCIVAGLEVRTVHPLLGDVRRRCRT